MLTIVELDGFWLLLDVHGNLWWVYENLEEAVAHVARWWMGC